MGMYTCPSASTSIGWPADQVAGQTAAMLPKRLCALQQSGFRRMAAVGLDHRPSAIGDNVTACVRRPSYMADLRLAEFVVLDFLIFAQFSFKFGPGGPRAAQWACRANMMAYRAKKVPIALISSGTPMI